MMALIEINERYSRLADESCCLSCGGAINYSKAKSGEICVDLGSGRGTDVLRLAQEVGPKGFVYGIDISAGMLKKAETTAAKMGIENVKFYNSELAHLPIPSKSVDLIISNCSINHSDKKQQVWLEMARILRDGGRFVVSDIYALESVPDEYRNDPDAVAECWAGAVTRSEYLKQIRRADFSEIQIIEESKPYTKGKIEVASFTVKGRISKGCCCS